MTINPKTLKTLRERKGLTQQALHEASGVSKKTISRIESSAGKDGMKGQAQTLKRLAHALEVEPEALTRPPSSLTAEERRRTGLRPVRVLLRDHRALELQLVARRYGLSVRDIVEVAPLCFTLLAELSLKRRRERLAEIRAAFGQYLELLPPHLRHGAIADRDAETAMEDEAASIAGRDLAACRLPESGPPNAYDTFDPGTEDNPFARFLCEMMREVDPEPVEIFDFSPGDVDWSSGIPRVRVCFGDLEDLTNGDPRAEFALEKGHARIADIPKHLEGEAAAAERADWLAAHVPDGTWEERERELSRFSGGLDIADVPGEGEAEAAP